MAADPRELFGLKPLTNRDAAAQSLLPLPRPGHDPVADYPAEPPRTTGCAGAPGVHGHGRHADEARWPGPTNPVERRRAAGVRPRGAASAPRAGAAAGRRPPVPGRELETRGDAQAYLRTPRRGSGREQVSGAAPRGSPPPRPGAVRPGPRRLPPGLPGPDRRRRPHPPPGLRRAGHPRHPGLPGERVRPGAPAAPPDVLPPRGERRGVRGAAAWAAGDLGAALRRRAVARRTRRRCPRGRGALRRSPGGVAGAPAH